MLFLEADAGSSLEMVSPVHFMALILALNVHLLTSDRRQLHKQCIAPVAQR